MTSDQRNHLRHLIDQENATPPSPNGWSAMKDCLCEWRGDIRAGAHADCPVHFPGDDRVGRFASNDIRYRDGDHPNQTQFTPEYVLEPVRVDLGGSIGLDPCTTADNPVGATYFYTAEDDGLDLNTSWWYAPTEEMAFIETVFVNPPYSKAREPWVRRCITAGDRGQKVILLIPAATDTRIFQLAAATSTAVVYIKGRVKFGVLRPNRRQVAASHPSALIGWNVSLAACSDLGLRLMPEGNFNRIMAKAKVVVEL